MAWVIKRTDTFLETFAQVRNNKRSSPNSAKNSPGFQKIPCTLVAGYPVHFTARSPRESQNNTGLFFSPMNKSRSSIWLQAIIANMRMIDGTPVFSRD
jgi:hypothetical protein